jgi:hypothetical protein
MTTLRMAPGLGLMLIAFAATTVLGGSVDDPEAMDVLFPDESHGFREAPNRVRSASAIVGWFEEHLKAR